MRILLADDHALFLEGLANLLRVGGFQVVGAARDGIEALELALTGWDYWPGANLETTLTIKVP